MTKKPSFPDNFDYKKTNLPNNENWSFAIEVCHQWLHEHMSMFGVKGIENFMQNQPISAAHMIHDKCDAPSDESITVALLGPAKFDMIDTDSDAEGIMREMKTRKVLGDKTIDLIRHMAGDISSDLVIKRDANRLFLVEGLSTMNDQLIDRKRIDQHHQVRWNILQDLEKGFAEVKGENPKLDVIFVECLKKSRLSLETLDTAAQQKKTNPVIKPPKF